MVIYYDELNEYLARVLNEDPDKIVIERLKNSRTNILHRVKAGGKVHIIKQYLNHVAKIPQIKMAPQRAAFECHAIKLFSSILGNETVPKLVHYDSNNLLIIEELAFDFLMDGEQNYEKLTKIHFRKIGQMLSKLHSRTMGQKQLITHELIDFTEYDLMRTTAAQKYFINEVREFKKNISMLPFSVVWADCCPKNILINNDDVRFIDFEFVHYNSPVIDIGFFIGHILLFIIKNPKYTDELIEKLVVFIDGYKENVKTELYAELIKLSLVYAGILLVHKTKSKAKYTGYTDYEEKIFLLSTKLIKEKFNPISKKKL